MLVLAKVISHTINFAAYAKLFSSEDKNAYFAKLEAETLPKFLANAEKFLKENGGEYFVGKQVS